MPDPSSEPSAVAEAPVMTQPAVWQELLQWIAATLGCRVVPLPEGPLRLELDPEASGSEPPAASGGQAGADRRRRFRRRGRRPPPETEEGPHAGPLASLDLPRTIQPGAADAIALLGSLRAIQQAEARGAWEGEPVEEPRQVGEIAAQILHPYQAIEGRVQLSGCTLEPRALLRLSWLQEAVDGGVALLHSWFGPDGERLSLTQVERLGLDRLMVLTPPRLRGGDRESLDRWVATARGHVAAPHQLVDVTLAWCRWASGQVRLAFAQGFSGQVVFEGWAAEWRSGALTPPPYRCPVTGQASYQVVALDDGTVTVAEAVGTCELTGQRVLRDQLERSAVSGKRVLRDRLTRCAVSGVRLLRQEAAACAWCDRFVDPSQLRGGRCPDCRALKSLSDDDPALGRLLAAHPELRAWGGWTGWMEATVGVAVGRRRWLQEVLVVFDPSSGEIRRRGARRRWGTWQIEEGG